MANEEAVKFLKLLLLCGFAMLTMAFLVVVFDSMAKGYIGAVMCHAPAALMFGILTVVCLIWFLSSKEKEKEPPRKKKRTKRTNRGKR